MPRANGKSYKVYLRETVQPSITNDVYSIDVTSETVVFYDKEDCAIAIYPMTSVLGIKSYNPNSST